MSELDLINNLRNRLEGSSKEAHLSITPDEAHAMLTITSKYSTLYEIGKLVTSEMDLESLLRIAMDKVIDVTGAQRGFIALVDDENQLDFQVARKIEKEDIEKPQFEVSRSIIQKVISQGETICLPDAMADATFGGFESVVRLQLLSVLCTPLKTAGRVAGLIYVDNSNVKSLFNEAVSDLLASFSEQIAIALRNAYKFSDLSKSHRKLASELRANYRFESIIGSGPRMTEILQLVADIADTDAKVLIQGENGTGKELVARALHYNSNRRDDACVKVNCGAIPKDLIESELFGHHKGSFTGAVADKRGKFDLADGGTIFLDEIAELEPALQVKLLRVLEDGSYSPVGAEKEKHCDVRVVAATNRDLIQMVSEGTFREDLYYRLNVIILTMPPLRERREDILLLVDHFVKKHSKKERPPQISKAVQEFLVQYDYPGNVRQLENIIQRAVILSKGNTLEMQHLPPDLTIAARLSTKSAEGQTFQERKQSAIEEFERNEIKRLLTLTKGKLRESARIAGMDASNFSEKIGKYGINRKDFES